MTPTPKLPITNSGNVTDANSQLNQSQFENNQTTANAIAGFGGQGYSAQRDAITANTNNTNQQYSNAMNRTAANVGISQSEYNNTRNAVDSNYQMSQGRFANNQSTVAQNAGLTNQQLSNTMNQNQTNAGLFGSQYAAITGNNATTSNALQTMMSNTQNTNQMNAQNDRQAYTNSAALANTGINTQNQIFANANAGANTLANMYNRQGQWDAYGLNKQQDIWNQRVQNSPGFGNQYLSALGSALNHAADPITINAAAQNASPGIPTTLWNQSLNMTQPAQNLISGTANQGTTTQTQSNSGD